MLVFGPVPSRRLGRSLGINNIPPKTCSYACVYCQVGRTTQMEIVPREFYAPAQIQEAVVKKLEQTRAAGATVDYLTFVSDGEPTLDRNLKQEIGALHTLGHKVAVISNASLIWREDVRKALMEADWVSLKMDAVRESVWRKVNRPHGRLSLDAILEGARSFADDYEGELVTETLLVQGVNDVTDSLKATAEFISTLHPSRACISAPTRPPTETWVRAPGEDVLHRAYQIFSDHIDNVEYIISYEGDDFSVTGDVETDLLNITAVHPMREDAVFAFLQKAGAEETVLESLLENGFLIRVQHEGQWFYLRRFHAK